MFDVGGVAVYLRGSHGLSAQRAQRMKSRGPKGFQLEWSLYFYIVYIIPVPLYCIPGCGSLLSKVAWAGLGF